MSLRTPILEDDPLYKVTEVASFLSISSSLVYKEVNIGTLHCVRFGRAIRIRKSDLEEFVRRHSSQNAMQQEIQ